MADVKVQEEATNVTDPDTLTELERMYLVQDPTGTPAAAQVATGVLKKRIRADKFNTASSSGGFSVPIDLGSKEGLILTLTGNVTTFALPTNGPAGTSQETIHPLRVVASGATRTIATGAFTSFDLGGSVAPASGYSIVDGAYKDFMLRRVHNGTTAVWFVDLLIPGTDVANTPAGSIAATTVQAAINELDTEKAATGHTHSGVYEPVDADILKADVGGTMTAGYLSDDYSGGTISSGTYTPAPATGQENFQYIVNGGAFTLAPPAASCSIILQITNNGSAGAITTSGFTKKDGDAFTTTNGDDFMCFIARCNGFSTLTVKALQ